MVESELNKPKGMKKIIINILKRKQKTIVDLKQHRSMKIRNNGYMDLHVEYLGKECGLDKYSVAHYHEQNGDLMKDPDMMFYDSDQSNDFYASSFEQDGFPQISQFSMVCRNNQLLENPRLQREHQKFSNQWSRNLNQQGFTKVNPQNIIFGDE